MTKRALLGFLLLISGTFLFMNIKKYKAEIIANEDLAVYVNDELQDSIPRKGEAMFIKSVCDNDGKATWDNDSWGLMITNMSKKTKCNLYFYEGQTVFDFDYTVSEQVFMVPVSGIYKLETWGSQGGSGVNKNTETGDNTYYLREGGYGGYSSGILELEKNSKEFINVGGGGNILLDDVSESKIFSGGYNGGGDGYYYANGGGATHIATKSGLLNTLENYKSDILVVAGGGAGTSAHIEGGGFCLGGAGGGYVGNDGVNGDTTNYKLKPGIGANQLTGFSFGLGESANNSHSNAGSGGGYFGGKNSIAENSWNSCGGGGSGYIGNPLLKNKVMYCYNCEESNEEATKTISTTCSEETPTENCAKKGNGYARITLVSTEE